MDTITFIIIVFPSSLSPCRQFNRPPWHCQSWNGRRGTLRPLYEYWGCYMLFKKSGENPKLISDRWGWRDDSLFPRLISSYDCCYDTYHVTRCAFLGNLIDSYENPWLSCMHVASVWWLMYPSASEAHILYDVFFYVSSPFIGCFPTPGYCWMRHPHIDTSVSFSCFILFPTLFSICITWGRWFWGLGWIFGLTFSRLGFFDLASWRHVSRCWRWQPRVKFLARNLNWYFVSHKVHLFHRYYFWCTLTTYTSYAHYIPTSRWWRRS